MKTRIKIEPTETEEIGGMRTRLLDRPWVIPGLTLLADAVAGSLIALSRPKDAIFAVVSTIFLVSLLGIALEILNRLHSLGNLPTAFSRMEAVADTEISQWVNDIAGNWIRVRQVQKNEIALSNFRLAMSAHRQLIEGYATGRLSIPYREPSFFSWGLLRLRSGFVATSLVDVNWWESPQGRDYLAQHKQVIDAGLSIRRVFIQERSTLGELEKVIGRHVELRIPVRIALKDELSSEYVEDYMVIDGEILVTLGNLDRGQPRDMFVCMATNMDTEREVSEAKERFDRLWRNHARPPEEFPELGASSE